MRARRGGRGARRASRSRAACADETLARKHAYMVVREKEAVDKLLGTLAPRYAERDGGYVRIVRTGRRYGDMAEMCAIEFVDREGEMKPPRSPMATSALYQRARKE